MPAPQDFDLINRLADIAGEVIRPYFRRKIAVVDKGASTGAMFDPVTAADKGAEQAIRALLASERPEDGILGEEFPAKIGSNGRLWVIDPVDGTRAFITGQTQWGTLIALNENGTPTLGLFDQPVTRERFIGTREGAELHSPEGITKLAVRPCECLAQAVLMTTHPWAYFDAFETAAFRALCDATMMSRFGGDCYAYGLLAMGFVDVIVEASLKPWDIQALIPIVEGAGGIITDWQGGPCAEGGRVIAAGDKRVHAEALRFLAG
ncbi:MAG: histidinol-phosphatase [Rhizomicrobium sp.]|nr:histidinol-phosphatase [Rhizomicrobium sp.]